MEKRKERIYLCLAHMGGQEMRYVQDAFDSNWVTPLGPNVDAFENELATYLGGDSHVASLSSGTAALHLALRMCGVTTGDYVICQSFTFCASANPILYLGASPLFVDSEKESWNMDPVLLRFSIEECLRVTKKKPKAIVVAHLYGMPAHLQQIISISREFQIPLVEDAAEALGSTYDGRMCGTFGDYGVLSFNGNKMITTSGGGALVCKNDDARKRALKYATQAREAFPFYQHETMGYNYRLSNVCAGIGRGQMLVLDDHIRHHRRLANLYREGLAALEGVSLHEEILKTSHSNYWLNTILLDEKLPVKGMSSVQKYDTLSPNDNVEAMRLYLDGMNIETRPLWKPLHLQPVYKSDTVVVNGVSESLFRRGLCLPSGPCVSDEDVKYIIESIKTAVV